MTDTTPPVGLREFIAGWTPAPATASDVLSAQRVQQLAATLDIDELFVDGSPLPPLWHWAFFLDWPRTEVLGPDGHPRDGDFLPPIPNRRRMFAGGRLTVEAPLLVGRHVTRQSEIAGAAVKHGRTGEMFFMTVRHSYIQGDSLRMVEEQDLVYRSDAGASTTFGRAAEDLAASTAPWSTCPVTNPQLLFRFSALTGNAHRIHYDEAYTTGTEGYPGLVVHGPLLALYMAELVRSATAGDTIRDFSFRLQRPVFVGDPIRVEGTPSGSSIRLAVVSGAATVHATATAVRA
jgi:3-methylfumaryl-CoA hydratase